LEECVHRNSPVPSLGMHLRRINPPSLSSTPPRNGDSVKQQCQEKYMESPPAVLLKVITLAYDVCVKSVNDIITELCC
jgi:hypothetical protein